MDCQKLSLLHRGKAKTVYQSSDESYCVIEFRDHISAFNGTKVETLASKGALNNAINTYFMECLDKHGVPNHHIERLSATDELVRKLSIIPIEVVVRNRAAGSLCKRYGVEKGYPLKQPLIEFFLKNDPLNDPLITDALIAEFQWSTPKELTTMREIALHVNQLLIQQFTAIDISLIDFKLEFGKVGDGIYLADEITPDNCRLWDSSTFEVFDKDRFRQDMGDVVEHYRIIAERFGVAN